MDEDEDEDEETDDDEDEEMLKLKLQAIEAKLKLKRLQRSKAKASSQELSGRDEAPKLLPSRSTAPTVLRGATRAPARTIGAHSDVVIPVSPVRDQRRRPDPQSPARVLLGIDKGLRAKDVSLKRPANSKDNVTTLLGRSHPLRNEDAPRPKSFAERIAQARDGAKEAELKQERIKLNRSHGFGLGPKEPEPSSKLHLPRPGVHRSDSLLKSRQNRDINTESLKGSTPDISSRPQPRFQAPNQQRASVQDDTVQPTAATDADDSHVIEPYSGFHIGKRQMDHNTLTRALQGKKIYSIPRLLKEVVAPGYEPPDCEIDYVVVGIIASKSSPLEHRTGTPNTINSDGNQAHVRPKFMVLRLTDLKWELDLFLFDTGFDAFWKLLPGTIVAILNPSIMAPKNKDSGAFSLKLTSSDDTIMEIGMAAHLGFCLAIKSDGNQCTQWVDARKTDVCEFHLALKVNKARRGRMEFNTMVGGGTTTRGGGGGGSGRGGRGGGRGRGRFRDDGLKPEGKQYDAALHEIMYIMPKELGFNKTRFLDDADADVNAFQRGMSREEMQRKRQNKIRSEAELAQKLSELGQSAGSRYLRSRSEKEATTATTGTGTGTRNEDGTTNMFADPPDARSLGLLGNRAEDVSLASTKRKRGTNSGSEPMGWGGWGKRGLLLEGVKSPPPPSHPTPPPPQLKSAQKDVAADAPSPKKRARFMLADKGIREPGRESLGNLLVTEKKKMDDSDSDLEIV
jgi:minichromosome maintenance protein 10